MSGRKRSTPEEMSEDVNIDEVRSIVNEIVNSPGTIKDKERDFERKYPAFVQRFPMLFKMVCKPDFDTGRLEHIFHMMNQVKSNSMSYDAASQQFGQEMFNTYVKPTLKREK